jgi:S1-C subfamily serine protease
VRFGTVPDFAFPGPGVKVESVVPDSPAAKAGVQGGDTLVEMAGEELTDLRGYSEVLKTLSAGQTVAVVVVRDGQRVELEATLEAR